MGKPLYLLCIFLLFSEISCTHSPEDLTGIRDLSKGFQANSNYPLNNIAESIKYISLEDTPSSLIQSIAKIIVWDTIMGVLDMQIPKLFLFNLNGKFLRSIGNFGKGPGEYVDITSFDIYDDLVLLYDAKQKKLSRYSINGKHLNDIHLTIYPTYVKGLDNSNILYYCPRPLLISSKNCSFVISDSHGTKFKYLWNRSSLNPSEREPIVWHKIFSINNKLVVWESFENNIKIADSDYQIKNLFTFNYLNAMPIKDLFGGSRKTKSGYRKYNLISKLIYSSRFYFFSGVSKSKGIKFIYDSQSETCTSNITFDETGSSIFLGISDNIHGGYPFWPLGTIGNGNIVWDYFDPDYLDEKKSLPAFQKLKILDKEGSQELNKLLDVTNANSNPVVRLITLKT